MLSDQDLRARLTSATAHLTPDLEAELETVFRRVRTRRTLRWSGYAAGVAAAVATGVLLVVTNWSGPDEPAPVEQVPVRTLIPERGVFAEPAMIEPGPWRVKFQDHLGWVNYLQVDVPSGWGQDDDVVLATGVPEDTTTRRLELSADIVGIYRGPCTNRTVPAPDTALQQAQALAALPWVRASPVEAASLDGHPGYQVTVRLPAEPHGRGGACSDGLAVLFKTVNWPSYITHGWTALIRLVDVEGHVLVVSAVHGPDASEADIDELVRMVDTATLSDP